MRLSISKIFPTAFLASVAIAGAAISTTQSSTTAPATQPAGRSMNQIGVELLQVNALIQKIAAAPDSYSDAAKRAKIAPKIVPLLKQQNTLIEQYAVAATGKLPPNALDQMKQHNNALLYLMNDPATMLDVNSTAEGKDINAAVNAFSTRLLAQWISTSKDIDAQTKLVDEVEKLDKTYPTNPQLTMFTFSLSQSAASDELADRLMSIATDEMKNPLATQLKPQVPVIQKTRAAEAAVKRTLASLENKPMAVTGKMPDGKDFTTADWKGKVVLVDFWASWCAPCVAELPRIKEIYSKYHDQGLEILSVSNDFSKTDLTDFIAKNAMPWPQLFNPDAAAAHTWNPTTLGYGIRGIPTMFLIDKKGICRSITARATMEDLIPKLLAE